MRYGELTVIGDAGRTKSGLALWLCKCSCGNEKVLRVGHVKGGKTNSCGCMKYKWIADKVKSHGQASGGKVQPIYTSWAQMKARCDNPSHNRYHRYGGRGITYCDRWKDFENFLEDMGPTWKHGLSIDRIDNNGNYEPSNCKWSTAKEQAQNRSTTRKH